MIELQRGDSRRDREEEEEKETQGQEKEREREQKPEYETKRGREKARGWQIDRQGVQEKEREERRVRSSLSCL